MKTKENIKKISKNILISLVTVLSIFIVWQLSLEPATNSDWQEQLKVASTAEFNGDMVTVRNVRNFRYSPTEADIRPAYYDKIYNLQELERVWYVSEPFNEFKVAGHTFVSFEFKNGDFLAITIEARKTKDQTYSIWKGMLRTYPLMYIATDERDVVMLRANVRKDNVYVYPVKFSTPENKRLLLVGMLEKMNDLQKNPAWYNTFWANCTSSIVQHINKLSPGRISPFSWQLWLTASADELALKHGLLDTNLSIEEARKKYSINKKSEEIGDVPSYSAYIRQSAD